ncbi:MAG: hypothetical protein ACYCVM_11220 [Acidiferrobacter sp.]
MTYEFNAQVFERAFAPLAKMGILMDVVAGTECGDPMGRMRVWRARWPGTFHPKMLCLLAGARVRICLGSANLTAGGLGENLEVWRYFEGKRDQSVLSGVRDFLCLLQGKKILPDKVNVEEIIKALPKGRGAPDFLSTLTGPLDKQVTSRVGRVERADIISPINGDPSQLVGALKDKTGGKYCLYTGDQVPCIDGISEYFKLERRGEEAGDEAVGDAPLGRPRAGARLAAMPVHAKVYAFYRRGHVDLFWGSANLSYSAWSAAGERANVDFLVHSRVSHKAWLTFRKKLPQNHTWKKAEPNGRPPKVKENGGGWALLHACEEQGHIRIYANKLCSHVSLQLRGDKRPLKQTLTFDEEGAVDLSCSVAERLGFLPNSDGPRVLHWRIGVATPWRQIPVNRLDALQDETRQEMLDLAQQLFQEYTGRPLRRSIAPPTDGRVLAVTEDLEMVASNEEEKELGQSNHQAALDRFVLEWRAIARRIHDACEGNEGLLRCRIEQVHQRILSEAKRLPEIWPEYRQVFVHEIMERPWQK